MTEEQRMEEGRRMFQIFAARMFEQRVLTAYREKVAQQRQELLLKELMEEQTLNEQRNAKKAREAQKRKDKKLKQKQAREEERARREAEKAAEEAAARAAQQQKLEEQRKKREEERKKKEAEKKKQEEERLRKEAERQRRLQEERERQAEAERKQREQKERERQKREEARKKEKEEKEREAREKKAKEEQERKAREEQERKAREQQQAKRDAKPEKEKESTVQPESGGNKQANKQAQPAVPSSQPTSSGAKRTSAAPGNESIAVPPGLQHPAAQATNSPHFQVATPVVPKAPTPALPRQPSHQGSHSSSPRSQAAASTEPLTSVSPQTQSLSQSSGTPSSSSAKLGVSQPMQHYPQPSAPLSPLGGAGRPPGTGHPSMNGLPPAPPPGLSPRPMPLEAVPGYHAQPRAPTTQFRGLPAPDGVMPRPPPGIPVGGSMQASGRGFSVDGPPGLPLGSQQTMPGPISTSIPTGRVAPSPQKPGSFERSPLDSSAATQPISRPSPIKPPSSPSRRDDVENLSTQLGSSALLDDTDVSFSSSLSQSLPAPPAPGGFGPSRASFGASPFDPLGRKFNAMK